MRNVVGGEFMKKTAGSIALAAALAAAFAQPAAAAKTYVVWGIGAKTCGAWTDAQRTDKVKAETYHTWIYGFLTGTAYGREGLDLARDAKVAPEDLVQWVDAYCEANPLMTVERAGVALLDHLTGAKAQQQ
ncbi:MAG: hypothetical protein DI565_11420 [Ancylobacter novellus]|uniref:Rap1a immunity protein domain-containing protein n=1 Tax=Ancylobacter novellus TaxID=921 RepID=A0A2W5KDD5_ANCNO|nr:MAG: hypothetical protein DI565_11420 [Ancylobacter novellus]